MAKTEKEIQSEWLDAALTQVAAELGDMLKSEHSALAKNAIDDAPAEQSEGSAGDTVPPAGEPDGDEGSAPPDASAPPGAEASAPPPGAEVSAPPDASMAPPGGPDDQTIQPAPSVEELQAEYVKLDPETLKMHYLACKGALMASMGADAGGSAPPPGAPPMAPPGAPPAGPPPGAAPMAMGEMKTTDGNGGQISAGKLGKSEKDLRIEELEAQVKGQDAAMTKLAQVLETPIRKSVKNLSDLRFVSRTEDDKAAAVVNLSKKEIQAKLSEKIRGGKLSKSEKESILSFTAAGSVDTSKIAHLLVDAK